MRGAPRRRRSVLGVFVLLALVLLAAAPAAGTAQPTFVDADIVHDTTWTAGDGPYRVVRTVTVGPNATLRIEPGTEVQVAEGVSIEVRGNLVAAGTVGEPVVFTASKDEPGPGTWETIRVNGTPESRVAFDRVRIEYATDGVTVTNRTEHVSLARSTIAHVERDGIRATALDVQPRLSVTETTFTDVGEHGIAAVSEPADGPVSGLAGLQVEGTRFEEIDGSAVFLRAQTVSGVELIDNTIQARSGLDVEADLFTGSTIRGNRIRGSKAGIDATADRLWRVDVRNNVVRGGETGIGLAANPSARSLVVTGNRVAGARTGIDLARGPGGAINSSFDVAVENNTVTGSARDGVYINATAARETGVRFRNNALVDNRGTGLRVDALFLAGTSITENRIENNDATGLSINAVRVRSTELEHNLIRSNRNGLEVGAGGRMEDLTVADNQFLDNAGVGATVRNGEASSGAVEIRDNLVAANAYGLRVVGPQTTDVLENDVVFNTVRSDTASPLPAWKPGVGVIVEDGGGNVHLARNDIYGHRLGLLTDTGGTVEAAHNYWGAASGPFHRSINGEGAGDTVLTQRGWVTLIPAADRPFGPRYVRPTPALSVSPAMPTVGESVTLDATASSSRDGAVVRYHVSVDGHPETSGTRGRRSVTFEQPGNYTAAVWVEDDLGVESGGDATVEVQVRPAPTTPSASTAGNGRQAAGGPPTPSVEEAGLLGALTSAGGLLGLLVYLLAVLLGTRGMVQTLTESPLTVDGRRVHGLALLGIAVWAVFGLLGTGALLTVSALGLAAWLLLTGVAFGVARTA